MRDKNHTGAIMKESCKEISSMIGKIWPLTALILALACVCLWGCEYLGEEPKLVESGSNKGIGFAMVSDSTALLAVDYYERYERSSGADWRECVKKGIRLVGTKGVEINYWEGLVDCRGEIDPLSSIHPLGDSTVLFQLSDKKNEFIYYIWKVGQEPVEKKAVWNKYIDVFYGNEILRQWKEGKFLFKYYDKFALLDTAANTITQITKEEAGWPDSVQDAQYFKDDLMTLNFISENYCEFGIMRNQTDTVAVHREDSCEEEFYSTRFNGKYINAGYSNFEEKYNAYRKNDLIFSTDSNWQISEKPVARYRDQRYFAPLNQE